MKRRSLLLAGLLAPLVLWAKPVRTVVLAGRRGTDRVRWLVSADPQVADTWRGHYTVVGKPGRTLLVGEVKAGEMAWFEESADGERVSGEWDGDWTASTFTGTWFNADESVKLAFELRRVSR
jgi:hypothetical protein